MAVKAFDVFGEISLKGGSKVKRDLGDTTKQAKKAEGGFGGMGKAGSWPGSRWGLCCGGVVAFLKSAADESSNMSESLSKSKVVFGESSVAVEKFGETAARSLGMSKQQAIEAAATFGNLFVSMGLAEKQSATMSTKLVQLAADLASFNNASPEDALLALRSGLVGESEPLRRFGVNLNEAALKEEALRQGLVKNATDVLPTAAKAQAAYRIILKQSATAQGDFARTADGLANQQRILNALFVDAKSKLGENLTPALLDATDAANGLLEKYNGLTEAQDAALKQDVAMFGSTVALTKVFGVWGLAAGAAGSAANKFGQYLSGPLAKGIADVVTNGGDLKTMYYLSNTGARAAAGGATKLALSSEEVTKAQEEQLAAMKAVTDKAYEQEEADIANRRSHLRLKDAKRDLNKAIKEHGKKSREAKEATLDYRDAVLDAKRADDRLAESKGPINAIDERRRAWDKAAAAVGRYKSRVATADGGKIGRFVRHGGGEIQTSGLYSLQAGEFVLNRYAAEKVNDGATTQAAPVIHNYIDLGEGFREVQSKQVRSSNRRVAMAGS